MKKFFIFFTPLIISLAFFLNPAYPQSERYINTINWFQRNHISINNPTPPYGFKKYFDCDSNPVYKRISGDTITFYMWAYTMTQSFNDVVILLKRPYFNIIVFPKQVQKDGSVSLAHLVPKTFLLRNDSLYILDNTAGEMFEWMNMLEDTKNGLKENVESVSNDFNGYLESTVSQMLDRQELQNLKTTDNLYSAEYPAYFKVIFNENMFKRTDTVELKREPIVFRDKEQALMDRYDMGKALAFRNSLTEKVYLLRKWEQGGVKYNLIRFEGNTGLKAYGNANDLLFTSNGTFPDLENCQVNKKVFLAAVQAIRDSVEQKKSDSIYISRRKLKSASGLVIKQSNSNALAWVSVYHKYGLIDQMGNEVIPIKYNWISAFHEGLAAVSINDKGGYINVMGKEVIPVKYNGVRDFKDGLAAVQLDKHWALIDKTGKEVFVSEYDGINSLSNGFILVVRKGKYGVINTIGKEVVPLKYDHILGDFSTGVVIVQLDTKYGLIGENGREVCPLKYDGIGFFSEGLALVQLGRKAGFIDRQGKEVIAIKYTDAKDFRDGLAIVAQDGKYGVVNKTGMEVIPFKYDEIRTFNKFFFIVQLYGKEGLIDRCGTEIISLKYNAIYNNQGEFATVENGYPGSEFKKGLIDSIGNEVVAPKYEIIDNHFSEGLTVVSNNKRFGFVDKKGKEVIDLEYENALPFSNGLAAVKRNEKWGFINREGKEIISPKYEEVDLFYEGLAAVSRNKKWGFIDVQGKEVIPLKYDSKTKFSEGLAAVSISGKWGYIDKKGNEVIPFAFDYVREFDKNILSPK